MVGNRIAPAVGEMPAQFAVFPHGQFSSLGGSLDSLAEQCCDVALTSHNRYFQLLADEVIAGPVSDILSLTAPTSTCHRSKTALPQQRLGNSSEDEDPTGIHGAFPYAYVRHTRGILDPDHVVNVCFRQLVLKYSDYSGKLTFFDRISCDGLCYQPQSSPNNLWNRFADP